MLKWIKHKKSTLMKIAGSKRLIYLPEDFAETIIELEMKCNRPDFNKKDVSSLMGLYTVNLTLKFSKQ
jgi:hypothetical protein